MNEHGRHLLVLGVAALIIAMGGAVAIWGSYMDKCDDKLFMVALGIIGAGSTVVAAEFGLMRGHSPQQPPPIHPATINQQEPREPR